MVRMNRVADIEADVALAARGDARAFERVYRATAPRVHALARRILGDADADEATQEVFVRTWKKLSTYRGESAFTTWLHRLALNVVLDRDRRRRAVPAEARAVDEHLAAVAADSRNDDRIDLDSAISRLPNGARQVFVLHDVEGHRHEEIAVLLDVSVGTSKSQLHRARMLLRRSLTEIDHGRK
ncbi:MAG: RNA polymerase sigma factor [Planctomycetes bacterium]|nr:RNA polymerase sigma factor [Planctomycetota bacterium]MBI3847171.1 RNA polymerase sigma factor [Planctomycetota bacterium]